MSSNTLPPPGSLAAQALATQTSILDLLFEPSPPLHVLALPVLQTALPTSTYLDVINTIRSRLLALHETAGTSESGRLQFEQILLAHPRLGAKKVESAQSRAEQAQLRSSTGGDAAALAKQAARLTELNAAYESKYPGLRYVVFVNGRGREEIMRDMLDRIEGTTDLQEEQRRAVEAMCDIALDRASKLA